MNLANSINLIKSLKHKLGSKIPLCFLCLTSTAIKPGSLSLELVGSNKFFITKLSEISENIQFKIDHAIPISIFYLCRETQI